MILLVIGLSAVAQDKITPQKYLELYAESAVREMKRSGVPASITLAQGMLESSFGNSELAQKANNHFGIKCHSDWTGKSVKMDDDAKNECFRKYNSVYESYVDHSDFLKNRSRYAELFDLKITDYKGWAKGLKKAGYATNPKYADLLIDIIERYDLHQYDDPKYQFKEHREDEPIATEITQTIGRKVYHTPNDVDYIFAEEGDTWQKLAEEFDLHLSWLKKYNDVKDRKDIAITEGMRIYIKPKRCKAKEKYHFVKDETMWEISQMYAVKLKKLYKKNRMTYGQEPEPGQKIHLKKKIKRVD